MVKAWLERQAIEHSIMAIVIGEAIQQRLENREKVLNRMFRGHSACVINKPLRTDERQVHYIPSKARTRSD